MKRFLFLLSIFHCLLLADNLTDDLPQIWDTNCHPCLPPCPLVVDEEEAIVVDLQDPVYEGGILSTDQGGVLTTKNLRIQARHITYNQQTVACHGDLLIDLCGQLFIGDSLSFDFTTQSGVILCAKTAYFPWQVRGERILIYGDGHFVVENGLLTTSEGDRSEVALVAKRMRINPSRVLTCSSVKAKLCNKTVFALPAFTFDLTTLRPPPIQMGVGWGGYLGTYLSLRYHLLRLANFNGYLRLDGFLDHGMGVGAETDYNPSAAPASFYTRNYWVHDIAIDDPRKRDRYRFQGSYYNAFFQNQTTLSAVYDVVSDAQMAADYQRDSFELNPAHKSELFLHHKRTNYLANLTFDVRVNSFQTVNQKLPEFEFNLHPVTLPYTNIIFENSFKISHLNYVTSSQLINQTTFSATRFETNPRLYMPVHMGPLTITPDVQFIGIGYSDSPQNQTSNQILFDLSCDAQTSLFCRYSWGKHLVRPYARYTHLTSPSTSLNEHFIFSLEDGYQRLDLLRFGLYNLLTTRFCYRPLSVDIWSNAFFNPISDITVIPKSYFQLQWLLFPTLSLHLDTAMNYQRDCQLDYLKTGARITLSENSALNVSFNKHSRYDWRKADFYNFILDAVRDEQELLDSQLSDRRHTFLLDFFWRINPDWDIKLALRQGSNYSDKNSFFEYEIASSAMVLPHWRLHFNYQKREVDNRFKFSLKLAK